MVLKHVTDVSQGITVVRPMYKGEGGCFSVFLISVIILRLIKQHRWKQHLILTITIFFPNNKSKNKCVSQENTDRCATYAKKIVGIYYYFFLFIIILILAFIEKNTIKKCLYKYIYWERERLSYTLHLFCRYS